MNYEERLVLYWWWEESQAQGIACTRIIPASGRPAATTDRWVNVMDRWEYCQRVLHTSGPYETFMVPLRSSDSTASK